MEKMYLISANLESASSHANFIRLEQLKSELAAKQISFSSTKSTFPDEESKDMVVVFTGLESEELEVFNLARKYNQASILEIIDNEAYLYDIDQFSLVSIKEKIGKIRKLEYNESTEFYYEIAGGYRFTIVPEFHSFELEEY